MSVKTTDNQSPDFVKNLFPPSTQLPTLSPFHVNQTKTMKGKKQHQPKWLICELYLINTFRAVGLRALNRLIAWWVGPHLFVYRGGVGHSSATQKPWAYFNFSVLQFAPRLLPKKHKYGLWNERGICFSHSLRCRWGSGNGRLDFGC